MTTDHNEAMRLADWLRQNSSGVYRPAAEAADLLTRQAAELKSARAETNRIIALLDAANDERKALRAEVERLRVERERWYTSFEHVSRILGGIHALMYPEPFTLSDGRTVVFRPKDPGPHEILQALSNRIRAIPDEIAALDASRTTHKDQA